MNAESPVVDEGDRFVSHNGFHRPICVLSASTFSQEGGIQRVTQMVLRFLQREWPTVPIELLSLHDDERHSEEARQHVGNAWEGLLYRGFGSSRRRYSFAAVKTMRRRRPGLVIVDHAHLGLLPRLAFPFFGPPCVSFVYHAELPTLSLLRRWAIRRCELIIAISEFAASEAQRTLGTACPIALCRLGLFPDFVNWARMPRPVPRDMVGRRCIVIVGRMADGSRDKGHESLIWAIPQVARSVPDVLLVIVGRGSDEGRLRQLTEQVGAERYVWFAGYVRDAELPAYYEAAEIFAMPSFGEGFGLVYLEAMFHAKPCVAGNRDAAREVVQDGETGLLVEPGNAGQVQTALMRLLADRQFARRLGEAGRNRLERNFTYEHFCVRLRRLLRDVSSYLPSGNGGSTPARVLSAV